MSELVSNDIEANEKLKLLDNLVKQNKSQKSVIDKLNQELSDFREFSYTERLLYEKRIRELEQSLILAKREVKLGPDEEIKSLLDNKFQAICEEYFHHSKRNSKHIIKSATRDLIVIDNL